MGMCRHRLSMAFSLTLFLAVSPQALARENGYGLKVVEAEAPTELAAAIRKELGKQALRVVNSQGETLCDIWLRTAVPSKATGEQIENGLTYREIEPTTLLGAIRYHQAGSDYRNQEIPAGVYTLRFALQPQDGDHMGTAPHSEFCLVMAAKLDESPDVLDLKELHKRSSKAVETSHPGVLLLFPYEKPGKEPVLKDEGMGHWVLRTALKVKTADREATLGLGLTVVGHSTAAAR